MLANLFNAQPEGCASDFALDRWRAGELDVGAIESLERHLTVCEACRLRHAALDQQAESFLEKFPALSLPGARMPQLADARGRKNLRARKLSMVVAALAVAAGVVLVFRLPKVGTELSEQTRAKGSARLGFHVKRGGNVLLGSEGQEVHPGDQLRFFVSSAKPGHLAILSRDGAGSVSEYYPGTGRSRSVGAVQNQSLESSVELDATLGQEELWAVFCDAPFAPEPLRRELESKKSLNAPASCSLDRVVIVKKAEP